jgi:hypothetical protein
MEGAHDTRLAWEELPFRVRQIIEQRWGAHVVEAQSQEGGFSPGLTAILRAGTGDCITAQIEWRRPSPGLCGP